MRTTPSRPAFPDPQASSLDWLSYFTLNTLEPPLPWNHAYRLTPAERAILGPSIQQFQLGENAEGRGLLRRAHGFAAQRGDTQFAEAIALFIQEEQRHSRILGRFLELHAIPCLARHWVDAVFRRVRALAGLELCMRVLATAEVIAVPYYTALARATASPLLAAICANILADEAGHLAFQAFVFRQLAQARPAWRHEVINALHSVFLHATSVLVWFQHGRVFRATGSSFRALDAQCSQQFRAMLSPAQERGAAVGQYSRI